MDALSVRGVWQLERALHAMCGLLTGDCLSVCLCVINISRSSTDRFIRKHMCSQLQVLRRPSPASYVPGSL